MKNVNDIFKRLFFHCLLFLLISLNACSFSKHVHPIKVNIEAAQYLNPDIHGEASPVSLTFYELRNNTLFDKVEFFKLQNNSTEALRNTLLDQRSFMVRPKEKLNFKYVISSDARYLGIAIGFRHLLYSEWKKVIILNEKPVKHLNITLGSNSFVINNR